MSYGSLDTGRDKPIVAAKSLNIGQTNFQDLHPGTIERTEGEWGKMTNDILRVKDHPLAAEYVTISTHAALTIERIKRSLNDPDGYSDIEVQAEKLADLYQQAIIIRGQVAHDSIKQSLGVAPEKDLESVLGTELDTAADATGELGEPIRIRLEKIMQALAVNPADVIDGTATSMFFTKQYGRADVNFTAVEKSEQFLADLRSHERVTPELADIATRLQLGLDQLKAINPVAAEQFAWHRENFAGKKINWEPIRVIVGLTAAFIFTLGMGQTLFTKEHKVSPATVLWGLIALGIIKPSIFGDGAAQAVNSIASMDGDNAQQSIAAGFKGELAALAVEELQEIRRSDAKLLDALAKSKAPLNDAQIGELAGEDSSLMKILSTIKEKDRAIVLRTFGHPMDAGEVEVAQKALRLLG